MLQFIDPLKPINRNDLFKNRLTQSHRSVSQDLPGSYLFTKPTPQRKEPSSNQRLVTLAFHDPQARIQHEISLYKINDSLEKQQKLLAEIKEQMQKQQIYYNQKESMLQNNNYFTNFEKEIVTELKSMKEKLRDIELEKARKEYFLQYPSYLQSPPGYYHNPQNPFQYNPQAYSELIQSNYYNPSLHSGLPVIKEKQGYNKNLGIQKNTPQSFIGAQMLENISKLNSSKKNKSYTEREVSQFSTSKNHQNIGISGEDVHISQPGPKRQNNTSKVSKQNLPQIQSSIQSKK